MQKSEDPAQLCIVDEAITSTHQPENTEINSRDSRESLRVLTFMGPTSVALLISMAPALTYAGVLEDAKGRGTLVVGTEFESAPYEFLDGDTPVGFDVDLVTLIAQDLGLNVRWVGLPWASVLPALEAKRFDMVVAGTTRTRARLERYDMTLPIGDATVGLVKMKTNSTINTPADIAGKVVGGMRGSAQLAALRSYAATLPVGVKDIKVYIGRTNAYSDLAAGRISAVVGSLPNLSYLVKTRPEYAIVIPPIGSPAYFSWTLRKGPESETLLKAVNDEIRKFDSNGTVRRLQMKWFGQSFPLPKETLPDPAN